MARGARTVDRAGEGIHASARCAQRRALPWVEIEKSRRFDGSEGPASSVICSEGKNQLAPSIISCSRVSCSFWADGCTAFVAYRAAGDTRLIAISRAPLAKLQDRANRMGWTFPSHS
jgi:predicted dithiol-disulfide oxidoreductase (DUF899 family)